MAATPGPVTVHGVALVEQVLRANVQPLSFGFTMEPFSVYDGRPVAKARARFAWWRRDMRWRFATAWKTLRHGDCGCSL